MAVGTIGAGAGAHPPMVLIRNNVLDKDDEDDGDEHIEEA
jgi:hypothetical protein